MLENELRDVLPGHNMSRFVVVITVRIDGGLVRTSGW